MTTKSIALAAALACTCTSAQAQTYGPCGPERTIDALANAVLRVAPIFMKPRAHAETVGAAPSAPPASLTREQWKQSLIEQGRMFCARYPDDSVCGSNP
ncbi:MAG: hypothetical protein WAU53_13615 [Rhodoplanes sp.]|jgi:hypothetical protein